MKINQQKVKRKSNRKKEKTTAEENENKIIQNCTDFLEKIKAT
jgi:hypothetical protein